jgi:2-polyprenyl-6-methoxyphenol hydroxylase-like FAD-dependent oxidoreductase
MKILIVGGGIGGLTLAAFLEGSRVEYEIVEKAATEPAGFLLVLWDNARDILKKLGLAERFDAEGTAIHQYSMRDGKGRVLKNYNLKNFYVNYGTAITMVARRDLCHWLMGKVNAGKIRSGVTVTAIVGNANSVSVTFSTGETREYDAIIGADGVHSTVRSQLFTKEAEAYENWRNWWVWVKPEMNAPATVTEYLEAGALILVFSSGEKRLAILCAPADHTVWDTPEGRIDRLKQIFKDDTALVPEMFENMQDADAMPSDLLEVRMKRWTKSRAALIGDAAHSFGPHAGLGASMAMEDAYVLASELMQAAEKNTPIEQAFKNYEAKRKPRVAAATRLNTRMRLGTIVKSKLLRKAINMIVPLLPESFLVANYNRLLKEEL